MTRAQRSALPIALALAAGSFASTRAEPYLATREGLSCGSCHVNVTGGGARNAYGAGYGARTLPWPRLVAEPLFDGAVHPRVRLGADLRGAFQGTFQRPGPFVSEYELSEINLYVTADLLPDRLAIHVDERLAPGGPTTREAFAIVRFHRAGLYLKGGRFFLPYGLRLQDDAAATRRFTGFTFDTSDVGIEGGLETDGFASSLAITNGTGGGAEVDNGKQLTWTGVYAAAVWRIGLSATSSDLPGRERRTLAGIHGGGLAGPVVFLVAADWIRDDDAAGATTIGGAAHLELDWLASRGLNVRLWAGRHTPDRDRPSRRNDQVGAAIDWTLLPGLQLRALYRYRNGPTDVPGSRDGQAAVEVHAYF